VKARTKVETLFPVKAADIYLAEKYAVAVDLRDPNRRGPRMFRIDWKRTPKEKEEGRNEWFT